MTTPPSRIEAGVGQTARVVPRVRSLPKTGWARLIGRVMIYGLLVVLGALFALPFLWLVSTSLKTEDKAFLVPPTLIPNPVVLENYHIALFDFPLVRSGAITMYILVGAMIGTLLTSSLVAFGFARLRFPGRDLLFVLVLSTMMIPYYVELIPQYILFRTIHWLDTPLPLIVPAYFGGGAFNIFLLRQFFMTIPMEYDDSARIDGCGTYGVYRRIILPLSLPALGAVAIFTFMSRWNDFFGPLIYLNRPETQPLAVAFATWVQSDHSGVAVKPVLWVQIMAIATVITIPPIVVFFFAQRYFIQGVVVSGLKG
jgi:multiple sugar transport system permease protein